MILFVIINLVIEMDYRITTRDERETIHVAQNLESEKFKNMVICLQGDLGSGKTIFTKGFAQALGIDENITSPTFNIIKEYPNGGLPLYHMDVYRLNGKVDELGLDDYFTKGGIVIIEWADLIEDHLPDERLDIKFKILDEESRTLIFIPHGQQYEEICEAIL